MGVVEDPVKKTVAKPFDRALDAQLVHEVCAGTEDHDSRASFISLRISAMALSMPENIASPIRK